MKKNEKGFVDTSEFHADGQLEVMQQIEKDGVCPFCRTNLATYHREPVLWDNAGWLITENDYPYEGSRHHLLLICKRHLDNLLQLDSSDYLDLREAVNWVIRRWQIKGGTFLLRFGKMSYNGASVRHLHAHIIVGAKRSRRTESLKVKIGYRRQRG